MSEDLAARQSLHRGPIHQGATPMSPDGSHTLAHRSRIVIYTFGRFDLLINGAPLRFKGRAPLRALELLGALVAAGDGGASVGRLSDQLWPDADGFDAYRAFTTTLHRLRRLLTCHDAVRLSAGRLSLDPHLCTVDGKSLRMPGGRGDAARLGRRRGQPHALWDLRLASLLGGARWCLRPRRHGLPCGRTYDSADRAHLRWLESSVVRDHGRTPSIRGVLVKRRRCDVWPLAGGVIGIPETERSDEGVVVRSELHIWGQVAELLRVPSAQHYRVWLERRGDALDRLDYRLVPFLLA